MVYETIPIPGSSQAYCETYRVESQFSHQPRPAVIICPGGGYERVAVRVGELLALQFCAAGFHAFILHYQTPPPQATQPITELAHTMALLRSHSTSWELDPNRIAVFGESAGGHLAASLGVFWSSAWLTQLTGLTSEEIQPNALVLAYPVITAGPFRHDDSFRTLLGNSYSPQALEQWSVERYVGSQMPPTFMWHTAEDELVPVENSLLLSGALSAANVPFALHVFPNGRHGMALCSRETARNPQEIHPQTKLWVPLAVQWLRQEFCFQDDVFVSPTSV